MLPRRAPDRQIGPAGTRGLRVYLSRLRWAGAGGQIRPGLLRGRGAHVGPTARAICSRAGEHGGHRVLVAPWSEAEAIRALRSAGAGGWCEMAPRIRGG